jgi:hypothetical protein
MLVSCAPKVGITALFDRCTAVCGVTAARRNLMPLEKHRWRTRQNKATVCRLAMCPCAFY